MGLDDRHRSYLARVLAKVLGMECTVFAYSLDSRLLWPVDRVPDALCWQTSRSSANAVTRLGRAQDAKTRVVSFLTSLTIVTSSRSAAARWLGSHRELGTHYRRRR